MFKTFFPFEKNIKCFIATLPLIFCVVVSGALGQVTIYPAPSGAPLASDYAVTVNGSPVPVYDGQMTGADADYATFDMGSCVTIQVYSSYGFPSFVLRPKSANLNPTFAGNTVTFTLGTPRSIQLEFNGMNKPLLLFVNPPESGAPSSGGPNVIYYAPGLYTVSNPITVASNQILYLAGGAFVYGQVRVQDGASNVCIRGRGILSGNGLANTWLTGSMCLATNANAVTLQDLIFADGQPNAWTSVFWGCTNVMVSNYKVLAQNGNGCDGLDLVSTKQVEVKNSFFYTDDDAIAIKARQMNCSDGSITCMAPSSQNVFIHDNVLDPTWARGVEIGAEIFSGASDPIQAVTVQNNDFINVPGPPVAMPIFAALGIHDGGDSLVQNIHYWNNRVEDPAGRLFEFNAACTWVYDPVADGIVQNIDVTNLAQVSGPQLYLGNLMSYNASVPLQGVTFTNFTIDATPGGFSNVYLLNTTTSDVTFQTVAMTQTPSPTDSCSLPTPTFTYTPTPTATATWNAEKQLESFNSLTPPCDIALYIDAYGGTETSSIDTTDYQEGGASLKISYNLNAGAGNFAEALKNYTTKTQDLSFQPYGLSIWVQGTAGSTETFRFMLFEDHNMDGSFSSSQDDVWYCDNTTVLSSGNWTKVVMPYTAFQLFSGTRSGAIALNRIGKWSARAVSTGSTAVANTIHLDDLRQLTLYTQPTNNSILSGSWFQLWNTAGCNCGTWTQTQWNTEAARMKAQCQNTIYVQYGIWSDTGGTQYVAWYPSSLGWVTSSYPTIDYIMNAAQTNGLKVVVGLFFSDSWNTADKTQAATYSGLLAKDQQVIDELWTRYGANPAFGGWYIPQEIDDLQWQAAGPQTLLANWEQSVAAYCKGKSASLPVIIAPFFGPSVPADVYQTWWNNFFTTVTSLNGVLAQDGVGSALNVDVDVPNYFQALANACTAHGKTFGATVESFHQTHGCPVDGSAFASVPTDINTLKSQLWVDGSFTSSLVQFEWADMEPSNGAAPTTLYNNYNTYQQAAAPCFTSTYTPTITWTPTPTLSPTVTATPSPSNTSTATAIPTNFVTASGNKFMLNGGPLKDIGATVYPFFSGDQAYTYRVIMRAKANGLVVIRPTDYLQGLSASMTQLSNEAQWETVDWMIKNCKDQGLKVLLDLSTAYEVFKANCLDAYDPTNYTYWDQFVDFVTSRVNVYTGVTYKNDPVIFSYSIVGEPVPFGYNTPFNACTDDSRPVSLIENLEFHVADRLKADDTTHLVSGGGLLHLSDGVPLDPYGKPYWQTIWSYPHIDYAAIHIYPDWSSTTPATNQGEWVNLPTYKAFADGLPKPFMVEEFGINRDSWPQTMVQNYLNYAYQTAFTSAVPVVIVWNWGPGGSFDIFPHTDWEAQIVRNSAVSWGFTGSLTPYVDTPINGTAVYSFETGTNGYTSAGYGGNNGALSTTNSTSTDGSYSLSVPVSFSSTNWGNAGLNTTQGTPYNWTGQSKLACDVLAPAGVYGIQVKFILYNNGTRYEQVQGAIQNNWSAPGTWTTVYADISPTSADWQTGGNPVTGVVFNNVTQVDFELWHQSGSQPVTCNILMDYVRVVSSTPTPTPTASATSSASATPSNTISPTPTLSWTASQTSTASSTSTGTPTFSPTVTQTLTATNSATSTITNTPVNSYTPTNTLTITYTPSYTLSPTASMTSTYSFTVTSTPSFTDTFTATNTMTITNTPTYSLTPTSTNSSTLTFTPTNTASITDTVTSTSTATRTWTATNTATQTATFTPTMTFSPTHSNTCTSSFTPTNTATITYTLTFTYTFTVTSTPTKTYTPTNTWTYTFTPSNTFTGVPTNTPTQSYTFTPTSTITLSSTLTPVPMAVPVIYPNPADGTAPVRIRPPAYFGVSDVKVKLFTLAFRKVQENTYHQIPDGTDVPLNLTDKWGMPLASGLYYVVVQTTQGRSIGKFLILR